MWICWMCEGNSHKFVIHLFTSFDNFEISRHLAEASRPSSFPDALYLLLFLKFSKSDPAKIDSGVLMFLCSWWIVLHPLNSCDIVFFSLEFWCSSISVFELHSPKNLKGFDELLYCDSANCRQLQATKFSNLSSVRKLWARFWAKIENIQCLRVGFNHWKRGGVRIEFSQTRRLNRHLNTFVFNAANVSSLPQTFIWRYSEIAKLHWKFKGFRKCEFEGKKCSRITCCSPQEEAEQYASAWKDLEWSNFKSFA